MVNFLNLETAKTPDMQVDWNGATAPLRNALSGYRDGMNQQYAETQRKEQQTYDRGRVAKSDADQQKAIWGKRALAVDQIQDPNQRKAIWGRIVTGLGSKDLTPEELDPMTGPKLMAAEAGLYNDPRDSRMKDLELQKTEGEISLLKAKAASGGEDGGNYGKTGAIFQDPNTGGYYSIQFGANGKKLVEPVGNGLTPSRGVDIVGDSMFDKATGAPVRNVGANIAAGEQAKVVGRETGEGQMGLPKMQRSLQQSEIKADNVDKFIDEAITQASSLGAAGFAGGMTKSIPGSPAFNLARKIDPIVANLGFDELQTMRDNSPTGGALGAIAVQELSMLQSTLGSLDTAQSAEQLMQHLMRLKGIKAQFRELKRQAYQQDVARFGAAAVPNPAGPNQRMEYNVPTNRGGSSNTPRAGDPISEAKAAIAAGADPQKVMQRLQQMGIDPRGAQ